MQDEARGPQPGVWDAPIRFPRACADTTRGDIAVQQPSPLASPRCSIWTTWTVRLNRSLFIGAFRQLHRGSGGGGGGGNSVMLDHFEDGAANLRPANSNGSSGIVCSLRC